MMDPGISSALSWLFQTSLHASLIVILIIIVRLVFKSRLKPGWSYALWLILLCRLLIPQPVSIELPELLYTMHPLQLSQHYNSPTTASNQNIVQVGRQQSYRSDALTLSQNKNPPALKLVLFFIWFCGLILVAGFYIKKIILTSNHVRQCELIKEKRILITLEFIKTKLHLARKVEIRLSKNITSPASFGLIHPVVLLPINALALEQRKLALILEHELLHHKRLDIAVDALMTLLKSVHWFNPLIWLAHRFMRDDCELSCDYRVTRTKDNELKHLYAGLLIKFASRQSSTKRAYSVTLMSAKYSSLAMRIKHLLEQPRISLSKSLQTLTVTTTIAALSLTTPVASLAIETLIFDYSTSKGISEFSSKRLAKHKFLQDQENKRISGLLTKPAKTGKHPAIVLVHGCEGFDSRHKKWAKQLNQMGYITFRIQRHGIATPYCEKPIAQINTFTAEQVMDAYAALDFLRTLAFVDVNNINIMSWESWGAIGAAATFGIGQVYQNQFNSAIAMYPDCTATYNGEFNSPLLIMVGDSDQWAQAKDCISIQTIANKPHFEQVRVKVYTDTFHGFDNQELRQETYLPYAKNLGHLSTTGATAKYNHLAYLDARRQIKFFLSENFAFK